jgi:hypothetical protein
MSGIMLSFLNCVTFQPEIPEGNGRVEVVVVEVVVVFVVVVVVFLLSSSSACDDEPELI